MTTEADRQCARDLLAGFAHLSPPADFMLEQCANHIAAHVEHIRSRWDWWQKNAEAIAQERGELFRAGEALRHVVQEKTYGCTEVAVWDAAAQPIRDMLKSG